MTLLLVALGGAVGAPARYVVDRLVTTRWPSAFPWGTFVVNMSGCLLLGLLAGAALAAPTFALLGIGFCGAYTTYSTFGYEAVALAQRQQRRAALLYVLGSVTLGIGLAAAGYVLAS